MPDSPLDGQEPTDHDSLTSLRLKQAAAERLIESMELRFEERYQDIIAQFYYAQAAHSQVLRDSHAAQQERQRLRAVVEAKQEVIEVLLPYYPHPLTPELRSKIDSV